MKLHLRVVSGLQIGDHIDLGPPGGFIGRGDGSALQLREDSVSRTHLELRFQQDGFWAYQHSTRSPTLLDGVVLHSSPLALRKQGTIQVGSVVVEYSHELLQSLSDETESPPTMINVRRHLSTIQHEVLPKMTPLRAADPGASETPATLILRRPPAAEPLPPLAAPPTLIRRPPSPPPPRPPALRPQVPPPLSESAELTRVEKERDQLRQELQHLAAELQHLAAELQRLRLENEALRAAPQASVPVVTTNPQLAEQALLLLAPFGESLELTSVAMQEGDAMRARTLLREASFGLADLRDLFESAQR